MFAKSLVIILRTEFRREIGLKSPAFIGVSVLAIRVIKEVLILSSSTSPL
jgi:hypothetical protein